MTEPAVLDERSLEHALDALGWEWLRDKHGWYRVGVRADDEYGNLQSEYRFGILSDLGNALVLRLYGGEWFSGTPDTVRTACDEWNETTAFPKAVLVADEDADSRLVLEWAVPCWDQPVAVELVDRWIDIFREGCAVFLSRHAEAIRNAPRYQPDPDSSSTA